MSIKTLLVDGSSLFRVIYEPVYKKHKTYATFSEKNVIANTVYSFLYKLRSITLKGGYNNLRVTFDGKQSGILRKNIYPEYKSTRAKKRENFTEEEVFKSNLGKTAKESLKSILKFFCLFYQDTQVEADDVIAYYVKNKQSDEFITIATGDVDITQLISDSVDILYLNKHFKHKSAVVMEYENVKIVKREHLILTKENYAYYFGHPSSNVVLLKTLCGDTSDDIGKIKGLGEKTLLKICPEFEHNVVSMDVFLSTCKSIISSENGKLSTICENIIKGTTKHAEKSGILKLNKKLVDLSLDDFITDTCIQNLNEISFLKPSKFIIKDSVGLKEKLVQTGIYWYIVHNPYFQSLKTFFKPFKNYTT